MADAPTRQLYRVDNAHFRRRVTLATYGGFDNGVFTIGDTITTNRNSVESTGSSFNYDDSLDTTAPQID